MYSCFIGYLGRQRSNGITAESQFKPDIAQCRAEYNDIILQGSISVTRKTVSTVMSRSIQIHGAEIIRGVVDEAACNQLPTAPIGSSALHSSGNGVLLDPDAHHPAAVSSDWKAHIPPRRHGAGYFLNNPLRTWTAIGYFDSRNVTYKKKEKMTAELAGWIIHFRSSGCQALVDMASNMDRVDTQQYWAKKEVKEHQQQMAHRTRQQTLDNRKESIKQHRIDSTAMARELEPASRSPSPSENAAKRRRYNTRQSSIATSSSSSSTVTPKAGAKDTEGPLKSFMTHWSDLLSGNSDTEESIQGDVPEQNDRLSTASLSPASSESYEPSHTSSVLTPPRQRSKEWRFVYPLGSGTLHYPTAFRQPLMVDGYDLSTVLWSLRDNIAERVPVSVASKEGEMGQLERPHEFLALNHIYLVQRDDRASSMYACVGRKLWSNLQAPSMAMLLEDETAMELVRLSFKVASMDYQTGRQELRGWRGKEAVQDLLRYLVDTNTLWDEDLNAENELGLCRKRLDPFLSAYITYLPDSTHHWDQVLRPSTERRGIDRDSGGVRPDFQSYFADGNMKFYLLTIEIKKKQQAATAILSDLEKVALQLKDCLDNLAKQRINLDGVNVYGIVVIGYEVDLYAMSLDAPGLYIMRQLNKAFLPRNHFDLAVLPQTVNFFMSLQRRLQDSYALCTRQRLSHTYAGITATLGTPVKVPLPR
ncbi:hypothetical protein BGX30_003423 [Mortierella sp. GBA39]|nr:hypothetical protein BGX30_003423 [Mortierella sp. GBA39]